MSREHIRPLRFPLKQGDQIFYLHIPKTGGTSFTEILKGYFKPDEFYEHLEGPDPFSHEQIKPLASARLVRGHRQYGFQRYFPRKPVTITMLRDPLERTISHYLRALRNLSRTNRADQQMTLREFVDNPEFHNLQTFYVAGVRQLDGIEGLDPAAETASEDKVLQLAKVHLDSMPYFGILERFEESLDLLAYTFGWPRASNPEVLNRSAGGRPDLTPEIEEAIRANNRLDFAFYAFARDLFEQRLQQMRDEKASRR